LRTPGYLVLTKELHFDPLPIIDTEVETRAGRRGALPVRVSTLTARLHESHYSVKPARWSVGVNRAVIAGDVVLVRQSTDMAS
jgi:hypothetical protein